jgi:hypothetical protein
VVLGRTAPVALTAPSNRASRSGATFGSTLIRGLATRFTGGSITMRASGVPTNSGVSIARTFCSPGEGFLPPLRSLQQPAGVPADLPGRPRLRHPLQSRLGELAQSGKLGTRRPALLEVVVAQVGERLNESGTRCADTRVNGKRWESSEVSIRLLFASFATTVRHPGVRSDSVRPRAVSGSRLGWLP